MENLEEAWTRLSLSEHEGEVFTFENQVCRKEYTLTAKFFTKRAININVVARTLKPLWRTKQDFEIDRKSTRLNSSHVLRSRMPSSA